MEWAAASLPWKCRESKQQPVFKTGCTSEGLGRWPPTYLLSLGQRYLREGLRQLILTWGYSWLSGDGFYLGSNAPAQIFTVPHLSLSWVQEYVEIEWFIFPSHLRIKSKLFAGFPKVCMIWPLVISSPCIKNPSQSELASWGCHNKSSQPGWLKTMEIHSFTVPEARCLKSTGQQGPAPPAGHGCPPSVCLCVQSSLFL